MKIADLTRIRDYVSLVEEAKRVTDLPRWVHLAILAEYARDVFSIHLENFAKDVSLDRDWRTLSLWIMDLDIWQKTRVEIRRKLTPNVYYRDARKSKKYLSGEWTATQAVLHQKQCRHARSIKNYISHIYALSHTMRSNQLPSSMISPEEAVDLLDQLRTIAKQLVRIAKRGRAAA